MIDGFEWICSDHAIVDNNLYIITSEKVVKVDMATWEAHYIFDVENMEWVARHGVGYLVSIDEIIFMISWSSFCVAKFDTSRNIIEPLIEESGDNTRIFNIEILGDCIYIFHRKRDEVVVISKNGLICKYPFKLGENKFFMSSCRVNDQVWFIPADGKKYYIYILEKNKMIEAELPFQMEDCLVVGKYGSFLSLLDKNRIITWDGSDFIKTNKLDLDFERGKYAFLVPMKNKTFVMPGNGDDIYQITNQGVLLKYQDYPDDYCYTQPPNWLSVGTKYFHFVEKDGIYYFPSRATNYMLTIDSKTEVINWLSIKAPSIREEIVYELFDRKKIIYEKANSLKAFIEVL